MTLQVILDTFQDVAHCCCAPQTGTGRHLPSLPAWGETALQKKISKLKTVKSQQLSPIPMLRTMEPQLWQWRRKGHNLDTKSASELQNKQVIDLIALLLMCKAESGHSLTRFQTAAKKPAPCKPVAKKPSSSLAAVSECHMEMRWPTAG